MAEDSSDMSTPPQQVALLDVRCLQDPDYARRGVGRHTLALLRQAPAHVRLEGLADPNLPPVIEEARALLAKIHSNAYAAACPRAPSLFVALSPMTHDPLFAARILSDGRVRRVAVVYDFIPYREPARYLPEPADRLGYAVALHWLKRCDLFAPISRSAGDDLLRLLKVPAAAVTVTGAPLDSLFEQATAVRAGRTPRHVLVVGGGDPRKNPEVVIRAHARSAAMQKGAGTPLVIAGNYSEAHADMFRSLAVASGGRADLLEVPGHVSEDQLLEIYALALTIVCPSRDEGFSLPVVEGMAAGAPCLVSDIPAQRELVEDAAQRFAPDDDATLTTALERIVTDPGWRHAVLTRQTGMWPRFRAREVGQRFWEAALRSFETTSLRIPAVSRGRKPRVALLSPLPPDRSGVADYTGATCGPLGDLVDLHVFTETRDPKPLPGATAIRPLGALPHLMTDFDRVVSVVGNSHFHIRIFEQLRRYGGACIAHDARMLSYYLILFGVDRAKAVAEKELRRPVSEAELQAWLRDENKMEALFLGEIAETASPMIVHSPVTQQSVRDRHGVSPIYLPFSIYRPWTATELAPARRAEARARLGLPAEEVAIATFGFIHGTKAPEETIWALDMLRGWGVPATLHFVGASNMLPDAGASLRALIAQLGLSGCVRFVEGDYIAEEVYRDYLVGADLAVQLRTYGLGGLSGGLLDCVAAGLPTVTNVALAQAVGVPEGYTRCIPDALSPVLLAEALIELLEAGVAAARREEERQAYSRDRSFETYAQGLCKALELDVSPPGLRWAAA